MCQTQLEPRPSACPASLSPVPKTERHGQSLHRDPVDVFWGRLQELIRPAQGDEGFLQVAVTGAAPPAPGLLNRKGDRLRTEPFGQRLQVGCSSSQCPPPQVALEETHELERMAVDQEVRQTAECFRNIPVCDGICVVPHRLDGRPQDTPFARLLRSPAGHVDPHDPGPLDPALSQHPAAYVQHLLPFAGSGVGRPFDVDDRLHDGTSGASRPYRRTRSQAASTSWTLITSAPYSSASVRYAITRGNSRLRGTGTSTGCPRLLKSPSARITSICCR